jgi:uncharacterized membrane protein
VPMAGLEAVVESLRLMTAVSARILVASFSSTALAVLLGQGFLTTAAFFQRRVQPCLPVPSAASALVLVALLRAELVCRVPLN